MKLIFMLMTTLLFVSCGKSTQEVLFNQFSEPVFLGALGSETNPYRLSTKEDLSLLCEKPESFFVLSNDIDLLELNDWEPCEFNGSLNGRGFRLSRYEVLSSERYTGFFSVLGEKSEIRNLTIDSFNVDSQFNLDQDGNVINALETDQGTGTLAGLAKGLVDHVYVLGDTLVFGDQNVGGLIGKAKSMKARFIEIGEDTSVFGNKTLGGVLGYGSGPASSISFVHTKAGVVASETIAGGIVGEYRGTISQSISEADVSAQNIVGGFSGIHKQISGILIRSSLFLGNVFTGIDADQSGAFVGMTNSVNPLRHSLYLLGSADHAYTQKTQEGLIAHAENESVVGAAEDVHEDQVTALDFVHAWQANDGKAPTLRIFGAAVEGLSGLGTHDSPYQIKSAQDWNLVISSGAYLGGVLKVMNDIDFTGSNFEKISVHRPFSGILLGNGKTFSNISYDGGNSSRTSLITLMSGGEIKDLKVTSSAFSGGSRLALFVGTALDAKFSNLEVSDSSMVINTGGVTGGIAGDCLACELKSITVKDLHISTIDETVISNISGGILGLGQEVVITDSISDPTFENMNNEIGGVVGRLIINSAIHRTESAAQIMIGDQRSSQTIGGFVGLASGNVAIINSKSAGSISSLKANDSVFEDSFLGGFVGSGAKVFITQSYSVTSINSEKGVKCGGLIGSMSNRLSTDFSFALGLGQCAGSPIGFLGNSHPGFGFNALFGTDDGGECGMEDHRCETLTIDEVLTIATAKETVFGGAVFGQSLGWDSQVWELTEEGQLPTLKR